MRLPIYQIDAFASKPFEGNPAAVCPLDAFPSDAVMQAIAMENNLAETAFVVRDGEGYRLRWFTPGAEIELCGHATLATAHVLWTHLNVSAETLTFETLSGPLHVKRGEGGTYEMDFPATPPEALSNEVPANLIEALGATPMQAGTGKKCYAIFETEADVRALTPNMQLVSELSKTAGVSGIVATAPGDRQGPYDCVSRFFAPIIDVPEDPVTGSAHCGIVPYWSERLGKADILAYQASARGGVLTCTYQGDRVIMRGTCTDYLIGEITLPDEID